MAELYKVWMGKDEGELEVGESVCARQSQEARSTPGHPSGSQHSRILLSSSSGTSMTPLLRCSAW